MRFALVTITFFLENTNVMQTNEFKQTKGDNGNLLRSMTIIPDSSHFLTEHGGRFDVIPTSLRGLSLT